MAPEKAIRPLDQPDGEGDDESAIAHGHDHGHAHPDGGHPPGYGVLAKLLAPHSHAGADSLDPALLSSAKGIRATQMSLVALMLIAGIQLYLVVVTDSVALLADTIHNFSDAVTSVPLWFAFAMGRRAATRSFTFGYRRAEDLAGLVIVLMIAFSVVLVAWESIDRLLHPRVVDHLPILMGAAIVGFAGNELVAMYRLRVGHEIHSAALIADGYHARADGLTSLGVLAGAIAVGLGFPQADAVFGLLIAALILVTLWKAAGRVLGRLMDAVDPALVSQIEGAAAAVSDVIEINAVRARWTGHRLEASLHAVVDCDVTVAEGHRIAEAVRRTLIRQVPHLDTVLIHVDPCDHAGVDHHATLRDPQC